MNTKVSSVIPFENFEGMSLGQLAARELQSFELVIRRLNSGIPVQIRPLLINEWEQVKRICSEFDFALYIFQQPYGFAVGVYGRRNPCESIQVLLWLNEGDIPLPGRKNGFEGQYESLRALFETTHTERNATLIKQFGLEPLKKSVDYYTY